MRRGSFCTVPSIRMACHLYNSSRLTGDLWQGLFPKPASTRILPTSCLTEFKKFGLCCQTHGVILGVVLCRDRRTVVFDGSWRTLLTQDILWFHQWFHLSPYSCTHTQSMHMHTVFSSYQLPLNTGFCPFSAWICEDEDCRVCFFFCFRGTP